MEAIQVVGMAPTWGLPSPSPFCLKLETWLRMEKIPYTALSLEKPPQSKTGKVPYLLRADGSTLADSNVIIETLARERGIDLSYGASPEEQARAHAILRMIEENLYFVGVWERWMLPQFFGITVKGYFGRFPAPMRTVFGALARRKLRSALYGQGLTRHCPDRIAAIAAADIEALSRLLGNRPYFQGQRAGVVDASAYAMFANVMAFPAETPLKRIFMAHANLVGFCERMHHVYWSELPAPGKQLDDISRIYAAA